MLAKICGLLTHPPRFLCHQIIHTNSLPHSHSSVFTPLPSASILQIFPRYPLTAMRHPLLPSTFLPIFLALISFANGFYLPGLAPHNYQPGDKVDLLVNPLTSVNTLLPFDYYHDQFPFCRPQGEGSKKGPRRVGESLGSVLVGDRLMESAFEVRLAPGKQ